MKHDLNNTVAAARQLLADHFQTRSNQDHRKLSCALLYLLFHEKLTSSLPATDAVEVIELIQAAYRHADGWERTAPQQKLI